MKGNVKTYPSLRNIVSDALIDVQESDAKREQFTRWALKYFDEINFSRGTDIVDVELNMKPWKAVELPNDCIDWIAVGVKYGDQFNTFVKPAYDPAMVFDVDENGVKIANREITPQDYLENVIVDQQFAIPFFNFSPLGEDPGKLYGLKVHDNGLGYVSENKNKDSCELQFRGSNIDVNQKVLLKYLTNGKNPCGETLVHPYFKEYIIAGIHLERARHGGRSEAWKYNAAKEEFDRQWRLVLDYSWEWSAEDIQEILRSGYGLYPKK